jgi:hypothetical protein
VTLWPFRRKASGAADKLRGEWACSACGTAHSGMFDLSPLSPDPWPHARDYEPNASLRLDGDFLSEDFCVMDGSTFFVRCVLPIPVHGMDHDFAFGCWGTLKRENFEHYVDNFDAGTVPPEAPFFSWLCNSLRPFDLTEPLACEMQAQERRQRPVLFVLNDDHPLAVAQRDGVSPEEVMRYYALHGHGRV